MIKWLRNIGVVSAVAMMISAGGAVLSLVVEAAGVNGQAIQSGHKAVPVSPQEKLKPEGETRIYGSTLRWETVDFTTLLTYDADKTITVKKALDPMTVLCIEHQDNRFTVSGSYFYYTNPQPTQPVTEVPKQPTIPARTCKTLSAWLTETK